ncbi:MAG: methyltransferase domain-containing protein [Actinomycetota bacterium]
MHSRGANPGTKEFFENVLEKRSTSEMPWLFELVPFISFRGKRVLELGCGAGYDAYEFCRQGAEYVGIDIASENIERSKKHLSFYGYSPIILEADAEDLPFEDKSFDAVFSNGVLHHTPDILKSFREAYRVLKQNGEFWVILYHKNSIFYWISLFLVKHIFGKGYKEHSFKERLSMIEYTTSNELPLVNVYTRRILKRMLKSTGFAVESTWVRKLTKEDLPIIHIVDSLWQFIPQPLLDFVGKRFGWYVIAKARKKA